MKSALLICSALVSGCSLQPILIDNVSDHSLGEVVLVSGALRTEQRGSGREDFYICPGRLQGISQQACIYLEVSETTEWNLHFTDLAIVEAKGRLTRSEGAEALAHAAKTLEVIEIDHVYIH